METQEIELDIAPDTVSPAFLPHLQSRVRHLLLWGGRDSTKSDFVALLLLIAAMELPYLKCILLRAVQNTVADSQIATLMKVAEREGLSQFFDFRPSALRITCKLNGNSFIGRGTDNMDKVKSVSDPTHVWYEEANQIAGADAEIVSTTLRSSHAGAVIQEIYTFNPDHQGDYKQFWIWKRFFEATGHPDDTTFAGRLQVDVSGELIQVPYQVVHSTYRNNPWCPPERAATYEAYQTTDPYRYRVWCQGLWAAKKTDNEFYAAFSRALHVKPTPYLPGLPILSSWDANALPYSHVLLCQPERIGEGLRLRFFHEYALTPPRSGIANTGKQFLLDRKANGWESSPLFLTGDSTLRNSKLGENRGESLFEDVQAAVLPALHSGSADLWPKKNAGVMRRGDFINYLLRGGVPGITVQIDPALARLIEDLEQVQKGVDGKVKPRFKDKELGATYEKYGHAADNFDYVCLTHPLTAAAYEAFKNGRDG